MRFASFWMRRSVRAQMSISCRPAITTWGKYDKRRRDWPDYKARFFRRGGLAFPATIHACVSIKSSNVWAIQANSSICIHHLTSPSVNEWMEKTNRYTSQADRDSWFHKSESLSVEFVRQRIDYWFNNLDRAPNEYPTAYALMRVTYDLVDRLKRWEVETGIDGAREFSSLCASLQAEYDQLEQPPGGSSGHGDDAPADALIATVSPAGFESFQQLLRAARQKEELGLPDDEVISAYVAAAEACPGRAEALHGAALYCRNKGLHERGYEFAAKGLAIPYPEGAPQVEDWIYEYGLHQELSIVANYARDPARKDRGFAACNWLALNRGIPGTVRDLAFWNLHFYFEAAARIMPSFAARQIAFTPPEGYRSMNPSVARFGDEIMVVQRCVNYKLDERGRCRTDNGAAYLTRNFLLRMDATLDVRSAVEILPPEDMPELSSPSDQASGDAPPYRWRDGGEGRAASDPQFEDLRLFLWRDGLWCVGATRELSPEGWYQPVLARIDEREPGSVRLTDWRVLLPDRPRRHEKNWMPQVSGDSLNFIYSCDPTWLVDDQGQPVSETVPPIAADEFRGGSQAILFDGGWLTVIHEMRLRNGEKHYRHRFVWFDAAIRLRSVGRPFFFAGHGVEFVAGLAWHPDNRRLIITYGVADSEAWIATVDADDVRQVLEDAERLPSGKTEMKRCDAVRMSLEGSCKVGPVTPVCGDRINQHDCQGGGATKGSFLSSRQYVRRAVAPIFIHSAPRTSSTWFWGRFRQLPSTLCFYEAFNEALGSIDRVQAARRDALSWDSRHSQIEPYYQEYIPLIRRAGGARLFEPAMTNQWFVPIGGLQGELRRSEKRYLALLMRHATRAGKIPVFGGWRTLGRLSAIKSAFGGVHILQYRNLWQQWELFLYHKNHGEFTFYNSIVDTIFRYDDSFFSYLADHYLARATEAAAKSDRTTPDYRSPSRAYVTLQRDAAKVRLLELLPEHDMFAAFMAMHIYLYLHGQLLVDFTADVTRMSRDDVYRSDVERAVERNTGLTVSFSDVVDVNRPSGVEVNVAAIDWEQIREHTRVAISTLADLGNPDQLTAFASEIIEATLTEMLRSEDKRKPGGSDVTVASFDPGTPREQGQAASDASERIIVRAMEGSRKRHTGQPKFLPPHLESLARPFWTPTSSDPGNAPPAWTKKSEWAPSSPIAGTELMVTGLYQRLGAELDRINLKVNHPGSDTDDKRPMVLWMHHDINQQYVQWCKDRTLVGAVQCFVFVSDWQRERYIRTFGLPPERCVVLQNATNISPGLREWKASPVWRCAYTSTPFRGLSVLLDTWERLSPAHAELHIWSSMKLYKMDDTSYNHLFDRAEAMRNVIYHGIVPNPDLRAALRDMHFLTYPSTFEETSCLAVIEAMAAGCRVIVPSLGALPETTRGFARVYQTTYDPPAHAAAFSAVLADELANPWGGSPELALAQQHDCAKVYDWQLRLNQWRQLIRSLCDQGIPAGDLLHSIAS